MSEDKFTMQRVGLLVSLNCNLKCKLCTVGSPYHTNGVFPSVEELMMYVKKYFAIVDHVEIFTISGGEPLLYKQLPDLLEKLLDYSECFDKLEIITNGTIVPSDVLLNVIKKYGDKFFRFIVDDYGRDLSKKIPEIKAALENENIYHVIKDYHSENMFCGGWIDHGPLTERVHTRDEALELFSKCAQPQKLHFCFNITDGCMTPCPAVQRRISMGQDVDKNEYIDLTDESLSMEEQRQKIKRIYSAKCLETCAYCTYALSDDAPRFKPAVQLTAEEWQEIKSKPVT